MTSGAALAQWQSVRLSMGKLGVQSTATEWIAWPSLGKSIHPNHPGKKQTSGFSLQPKSIE